MSNGTDSEHSQPFEQAVNSEYEEAYVHYMKDKKKDMEIQALKKEMNISEKTGLPNEKALNDFIKNYDVHHPYEIIVTYIDLKDFGQINRDIGHTKADEKIYEFAQGFKTVIREGDIIFNPHGDEFVLLSIKKNNPDSVKTPEQGLNKTLTRINNFSETKFDFESITFNPIRHESLRDAIDEADKKLMAKKQAKRENKN